MPDVPNINPDEPAVIPDSEASKEVWVDPMFLETQLADEPEGAEQAPATTETEATAEQLAALVAEGEPAAEEAEPKKAEEAAKPDDVAEPEEGDEKPLPRRQRRALDPEVQRRAQRRIASLEAENAELRAAQAPAPAAEEAPETEKAPRLEDHDYDTEAWSEALTTWTQAQITAQNDKAEKAEAEEAERAVLARQKALAETFLDREDAARERYEDYDDLVYDETLQIPNAAAAMIVEAENGPDIAYWLATNPDELAKFADMSDVHIVREIGRIETRLMAEQAAPATKPDEDEGTSPAEQAEAAEEAPQQRPPQPRRAPETPAPEPIPTILGGGAAVTRDPSKMSNDEYRAGRRSGKIK